MEFQNPIDRHMAHNTMFSNYRFGTKVLEKEGAVYDAQATHETQDFISDQMGRHRQYAFNALILPTAKDLTRH
jgi:hypothetical protein